MSRFWMVIVAVQAVAILILGGSQLMRVLDGPASADVQPAPLPGDIAPASTFEVPRSQVAGVVVAWFRPYLPLLALVAGAGVMQRRAKSASAKNVADLILNNGAGLLLGQLLPLLSR